MYRHNDLVSFAQIKFVIHVFNEYVVSFGVTNEQRTSKVDLSFDVYLHFPEPIFFFNPSKIYKTIYSISSRLHTFSIQITTVELINVLVLRELFPLIPDAKNTPFLVLSPTDTE